MGFSSESLQVAVGMWENADQSRQGRSCGVGRGPRPVRVTADLTLPSGLSSGSKLFGFSTKGAECFGVGGGQNGKLVFCQWLTMTSIWNGDRIAMKA